MVMNPEEGNQPTERVRAFERAAELLTAPSALMHLTLDEARVVVGYMTPEFIPNNTTFIREGDAADDGFMALLLEGEVIVETVTVSRTEPLTIGVLAPGSLVGEVGLVDREPRSASCTTSADSLFAILTRHALECLISGGDTWEVILPVHLLWREHRSALSALWPGAEDRPAAIYLRKTK